MKITLRMFAFSLVLIVFGWVLAFSQGGSAEKPKTPQPKTSPPITYKQPTKRTATHSTTSSTSNTTSMDAYDKAIALSPNDDAAYFQRGTARLVKGDYDGAIVDYTKAIALNPKDVGSYEGRGAARRKVGNYYGAIADFNKAIELNPGWADPYNYLAWFLATVPKPEFRDGKRAVENARKACELTNWQEPNSLDTLAAAYAETGDFQQAIEWEKKALEFPDFVKKKEGDEARQRLELYGRNQPYREQ